jgi:DNA-binding transcriptional ArsR family regulator
MAGARPARPVVRAASRPPVRRARRAGSAATPDSPDELQQVFAAVARYFALLAEPTRLSILHAICTAEQSVSAIVATTGATQTNVSRHLALLHQAGAVARRRVGPSVYYRVADPELVTICRTVCVHIAARIDAGVPLKHDLLAFAGRPAR